MIKGCVHNDIKPENILVKGGRYVMHDLGLAEPGDYDALMLPHKEKLITEVIGSPLYMSPAKFDHYQYCIQNNLLAEPSDVFES